MQKIVLGSNARQPEESYEGCADTGGMLVDVIKQIAYADRHNSEQEKNTAWGRIFPIRESESPVSERSFKTGRL
ncbi:MAG: hypothetical protein IJ906_08010 [Oscillospiraceae bacterium]|nr:hypothetical protein [Oscillospiraceae bacterium]